MMREEIAVVRYGRDEFLQEVFDYRSGEHVTLIGPTGSGKTHLAYELLEQAARPELPAIVIVMKPRDETVEKFSKRAGYRMVRDWPPQFSERLRKKPSGYVLKPNHDFDPDIDTPRHRAIFRRAILGSYKHGNRIVFGDELYSLCDELKLSKELTTVWTKGRSMEAGLWGATQRPSHVPLWAYSQAQHLFLAFDPDKRSQERYSEISGVDPDLVKYTVQSLEKHEWLYIHQETRSMCVVEA